MCKLKSMIALKDRIYIAEHDSHQNMLNEIGIKDDYLGASKKFVRLELSPPDGDPFSDVETWQLKVDQDIRPEWYSDEEYKPMAVEAVKEWAKTHIFVGVYGLKLNAGSNYYIKDCKDVDIYGSASVKSICGSASVEYIYGSASVKYIFGSASVKNICDSASVKSICDSASVENICDSASVEKAYGYSVICSSRAIVWKKQNTLILAENATFKDNIEKVIYQSGDYKLVSVESGKAIGDLST